MVNVLNSFFCFFVSVYTLFDVESSLAPFLSAGSSRITNRFLLLLVFDLAPSFLSFQCPHVRALSLFNSLFILFFCSSVEMSQRLIHQKCHPAGTSHLRISWDKIFRFRRQPQVSLSRDFLTRVSVFGLGVGSNHVYVLTLNPCVYVCSRSGSRL